MSALRESKAIVQHRRRATLGYMLLIGIIVALAVMLIKVAAVGAVVGIICDAMISEVVVQLVSYIAQLFILVVLWVFFLRRDKTRITQTLTQS